MMSYEDVFYNNFTCLEGLPMHLFSTLLYSPYSATFSLLHYMEVRRFEFGSPKRDLKRFVCYARIRDGALGGQKRSTQEVCFEDHSGLTEIC